MGSMSIWHWLVVAVVVLLLFGRGKIPELMSDVAKGISVLWAIGLVIILCSGLLMAWNVPAYRRKAIAAGALGLATFVLYLIAG